jgi:hypothetical protein
MGFIEETGAAQHYRDARIAAIYEGTNGIQSIDLVTRKLPLSGGEAVKAYVAELRDIVRRVRASNDPAFGATAQRLDEALDSVERATGWILPRLSSDTRSVLAGATPFLRLFSTAAGGCLLANEALAAIASPDSQASGSADRIALARFFAENIAVQSSGLEAAVTEGADCVNTAPLSGEAA